MSETVIAGSFVTGRKYGPKEQEITYTYNLPKFGEDGWADFVEVHFNDKARNIAGTVLISMDKEISETCVKSILLAKYDEGKYHLS